MKLIELNNVYKIYHEGFENEVRALAGVSLDIHEHEVVVIIGASGSGKSTLLRTINLLERIDDGRIILAGDDISDPRIDEDKARAKIGIVFQNFNLFPHKTVLENVSIANRIVYKLPRAEAERIGMEHLRRIGIADKAAQYPDQLSGGQQQRVSVGRALINDPVVILADEPTGNLDSKSSREIIGLLKMSNKRYNQTLLIITHDEEIALQSDRIITIGDGKIIRDESVKG